jgi:hypothetical protein
LAVNKNRTNIGFKPTVASFLRKFTPNQTTQREKTRLRIYFVDDEISTENYLFCLFYLQSLPSELLVVDGAVEHLESARENFPARHRDFIAVHSLAHVRAVGGAAEKLGIGEMQPYSLNKHKLTIFNYIHKRERVYL